MGHAVVVDRRFAEGKSFVDFCRVPLLEDPTSKGKLACCLLACVPPIDILTSCDGAAVFIKRN